MTLPICHCEEPKGDEAIWDEWCFGDTQGRETLALPRLPRYARKGKKEVK